MDLKDALELAKDYVESYSRTFLKGIIQPSSLSDAEAPGTNDVQPSIGHSTFVFVLVNILIGATITTLAPQRPKLASLVTVTVVLFVFWLFLSLVVHGICRVFGGRGHSGATIQVGLKVFSIVYVLSNFAALLTIAVGNAYPSIARGLVDFVDRPPFFTPGIYAGWESLYPAMLFFTQTVLYLIYMPAVMGRVHKLRGARGVLSSVTSAVFAMIIGYPVFLIGGC